MTFDSKNDSLKKRFTNIDFLRGIAAFAVTLLHCSSSTLPEVKLNYLYDVFFYGKYGVQVFFVISGFVIPYSLYKHNYQLSLFFNNLWKRFLRIAPPAYAVILLYCIFQFTVKFVNGNYVDGLVEPNFINTFSNIGFCVSLTEGSWFVLPFWSLEVEWQFYLLIGFLFPIVLRSSIRLILAGMLIIYILGYFSVAQIFIYAGFFTLGIGLFLRKEELITHNYFWIITLVSILACYINRTLLETVAAIIAFMVIYFGGNLNYKVTNFLARISYSLYITHFLLIIVLDMFMKKLGLLHFHDTAIGKLLVFIVYVVLSLTFAQLFYIIVEKPFLKKSKTIKLS